MKKTLLSLLVIGNLSLVIGGARAADFNPFFGLHQNQFSLSIGAGTDYSHLLGLPARYVPFNFVNFQYSQPTTFFGAPARQSLNTGMTIGYGRRYGERWTNYSRPIAWVSGDVALIYTRNWYMGLGGGVGMQAEETTRIGSKLLFQFKVILTGVRFNDHFGAEFYTQHFSNGSTTSNNNSYNFWGLGMTYNF